MVDKSKGEQFSQIWMPKCDSFWVPNEIKSCNFQHIPHLWFCEASQNLSSFRQLFFQGKMLKNCQNSTLVFQHFSFGPPWKLWKKSCLNELKFWEASRNHKWSICWKFQLFISLGTQKESHVGIHIWENCSPLWTNWVTFVQCVAPHVEIFTEITYLERKFRRCRRRICA